MEILFFVLWALMGIWGWSLHSYKEKFSSVWSQIFLCILFIILSPIVAIIEIITIDLLE